MSACVGGYSSSAGRKEVAGPEGKRRGRGRGHCALIICMYCSDRREEENILVL